MINYEPKSGNNMGIMAHANQPNTWETEVEGLILI